MPVTRENTNAFPMGFQGAIGSNYTPGTSGKLVTQTTQGFGGSQEMTQLPQVIGLVPLFDCCDTIDAVGGFKFGTSDISGCSGGGGNLATSTIDLSIVLGGSALGSFTYSASQPNATVQANIQAILPVGWTCLVTGNTSIQGGVVCVMVRTCTLNAPTGSGASGNVSLTVTKTNTGCGSVLGVLAPTGGKSGNCLNCDCREGKYAADSVSDDREFTLPVFADVTCTDSYHNDSNSWLIQYPLGYDAVGNQDFQLQELINGVWTTIAVLNDTTYGTPYSNNFFTATCTPNIFTPGKCQNLNYNGYNISWNKVLAAFGEGTYRFYASGTYLKITYCKYSPPFCLKSWDCIATDGTVKYEATYVGGTFGSVTTQGVSWSLCCGQTQNTVVGQITCTNGIQWTDSIRVYGFFGYEKVDYTRDQIKYATGAITKIRDEAIKNFTFKSSQLPMWFHRRFYSYGMFADQLFVSDYNLNNASYEYKKFWIVGDGSYNPQYTNYSRYPKVQDIKFKEGLQFVFRDRCCGDAMSSGSGGGSGWGNGTIPLGEPENPPGSGGIDLRQYSDLSAHNWADGDPANFA